MGTQPTLYYDGECGLCSKLVRFVLRHERNQDLGFVSLQSPLANEQLSALGVQVAPPFMTMFYTDGEHIWSRSQGALRLAIRHLRAPWSWLARVAIAMPTTISNGIYDLVAKNRFRVFGRSDLCELPAPEQRHRFL